MSKKKLMYDSELDDLHVYDINIPLKTVFIASSYEDSEYGESGIDSSLTNKFLKNLMIIESRTNAEIPLNVVINTPGGEWYCGMALYDALREYSKNCPIHIVGRGQIMSMGSIIMQAGDHRAMAKNSRMLIHDGSSGGNMNSKDNIAWAEEEKLLLKDMYGMFADKMKNVDRSLLPPIFKNRVKKLNWSLQGMGFSAEALEQIFTVDLILSAEDALALNLIDEIKNYD